MFPKKTVGAVTGIGGMAGGIGGIILSKTAGLLFDHYKGLGNIQHGYYIMFVICGLCYLLAWLIMHLLVPKMKRVNI
jgi:ACS family hexuronate transporter-like MFS transporter